jgi:hypothetical protein
MNRDRRALLLNLAATAGGLLLPGTGRGAAASAVRGEPDRSRKASATVISVRSFGAVGDGVADDTDAIQAAEDAAAELGLLLYFPAGVYLVDAAKADVADGSNRTFGIRKRSRTRWLGDGAARSVLKLKDGCTTRRDGKADPQMIYGNSRLEDIAFTALGFDLNADGNPIPEPPSPLINRNVCALLLDGETLELRGLRVKACRFWNGPGANVIVVQNRSSSLASYPLRDVVIENNLFEDNCRSENTHDHSTLNIWARHTRVTDNVFRNSSAVPPIQRYEHAAAVEFHAAGGVFRGNVVRGYATVVIASENFLESWSGLTIADNEASDIGHYLVSTNVEAAAPSKPIDRIMIRNNRVVFNTEHPVGGFKAGLRQYHNQDVGRITLVGNSFELMAPDNHLGAYGVFSQPSTDTGAVAASAGTGRLTISGNTFHRLTAAVLVDSAYHVNWVDGLTFEDNLCLDLADPSINLRATGLWLDGSASHPVTAFVRGNEFINEANDETYKHCVFKNAFVDLTYLDNAAVNIKLSEVQDH